MSTLENTIYFPFRLLWNLIVTGLIIGGFCLWFPFIFGSVIGVILILLFAPGLFLLPGYMAILYVTMWED